MKKVILVAILVAMLLAGIVLVASAKGLIKVTGSMNYPYGDGWGWAQMNIKLDPATGEAVGFGQYRSYSNPDNPKEFGGWRGKAVCGEYGEYNGDPAVVAVLQLEETTNFVVGQYIKFVMTDGGPDASDDMVGLIAFPPVDEHPGCDFEDPMPFEWAVWYGVNGNVMIHD